MWSDLLQLIPQNLKQKALDTVVDVVSEQAKKYAGEGLSAKVKKLRSDAAFRDAFETGLGQAMQRFIEEYQAEDEDLVLAISKEQDFFQNKEVQTALIAILKQPGAYLNEEREEILQTFVTVLPDRINRERVDLAVSYLLKCLAQELWHLPELMPIYSLQFQRIAAESAREQVNLQKAQLQALTSLNTGVREALLQLTDAIIEQKLLSAGEVSALPSAPKVFHNLPQPDFDNFIGREAEQTQIHNLLRPYPHSRHFLIVIDGIGGIGKSALALEIAHHYLRTYEALPLEERFEAIIWISAKSNILTAEGIVPRPQVMRKLNDIYTAIAIALQREDITRARTEEQDEVVRRALTQQRTLLVVDNLETIDDENVLAFLRELPDPTKAIVTTRYRIDVAYPIRLVGMTWKDSQALIMQECARKDVELNEDEARHLYDGTGGVPLALVWSIAQMGFGQSKQTTFRLLAKPDNDIALFCFEQSLQKIRGTDAYKLLMILALFKASTSREAMGYIGNLDEGSIIRDTALMILQKLSLVNQNLNGRFELLPLTKQFTLAYARLDPEQLYQLRKRQVAYYRHLFERPKPFPLYTEEIIDRISLELSNILDLLEWCKEKEEDDSVIELFLRIHDYMGVFGRLDLRATWGEYAIQIAEQKGITADLGRLYAISMGWPALKRGELELAKKWLSKGLQCIRETKNLELECAAMRFLGRVYLAEGQVDLALEQYMKILPVARANGFLGLIGGINSDLSYWEMQYGSLEKAEAYVREAIDIFRKLNDIRVFDRSIMLANILVRQERFSAAEDLIKNKLGYLENRLGQKEAIANAYACLAHIRVYQGNVREAQSYCNYARQIFEKIGMKEETYPIGLPVVCQD